MFEDFHKPTKASSRRQLGGSLALAVALYATAGVVLVAASATARQVVEEKLTQVEFAVAPPAPEPPPPPAPPPPPEAAAPPPTAQRPTLLPPTELPKQKLLESDRPLATADAAGPVDGFLDGVEGGRGAAASPAPPPPPPPPPPPLVTVSPPVALKTNAPPHYSTRARIARVEGTVVVSFEVLENGEVAQARVISGPAELHESVLNTIASWRFLPARRGTTPVRFKKTQSIVFRLEDA